MRRRELRDRVLVTLSDAAESLAGRLSIDRPEPHTSTRRAAATEALLVVSPHAGGSKGLQRARRAISEQGIVVTEELDIQHLDRITGLLHTAAGEPRLVIAAGGDGTVGSVAARLGGTDNVLAILPLGTGNDFARSLHIPINPSGAGALLGSGEIARVGLGRLMRPGQPPAYFVHAATVGLNVDFATLATRASVRERLGRVTYLAAAAYALRERGTFRCTLNHDGRVENLTLVHLSVMSAAVVGGSLGLAVTPPKVDHDRLDVLAIEDVSPWKVLLAGLVLLARVKRSLSGVRAWQVDKLGVDSERPLGLTLDGELYGTLPGEFESLPGALRVIVPPGSRHHADDTGED